MTNRLQQARTLAILYDRNPATWRPISAKSEQGRALLMELSQSGFLQMRKSVHGGYLVRVIGRGRSIALSAPARGDGARAADIAQRTWGVNRSRTVAGGNVVPLSQAMLEKQRHGKDQKTAGEKQAESGLWRQEEHIKGESVVPIRMSLEETESRLKAAGDPRAQEVGSALMALDSVSSVLERGVTFVHKRHPGRAQATRKGVVAGRRAMQALLRQDPGLTKKESIARLESVRQYLEKSLRHVGDAMKRDGVSAEETDKFDKALGQLVSVRTVFADRTLVLQPSKLKAVTR